MPSENQQFLRLRLVYLMRRLLILPLLLGISSPVFADLGQAESGSSQQKDFEIWCGKLKNDCTVTFEGSTLRVNGSAGITSDQVLFTERVRKVPTNITGFGCCHHHEFSVTYKKKDGSSGIGKFLIMNLKTVDSFTGQLAAFTGKPVGGADSATIAAQKAAAAQSGATMMQGVQMMQQGLNQ